ncbi:MAG: hypothetical protein C4519_15760 [Desulfobacteraceae bacterium]|nr:MAG: hypothetical protein C4519_15760 [Desulfobacteraceae bacterium]
MFSSLIAKGPLAKFQAKRANEEGTLELLISINKTLTEGGLSESQLIKVFGKFWPDYMEKLKDIAGKVKKEKAERTVEDILKEILDIVRTLERSKPVSGFGFGMDILADQGSC